MTNAGGAMTLRRLVAEATAIFVGVAAALAGQAWFEARAERTLEREFLVNALNELELIERGAIDNDVRLYSRQLNRASKLLSIMAAPLTPERGDSILELAGGTSNFSAGEQLEALDALFSPEALRLVRDAELRSKLGRLRGRVRDLREAHEQHANFVQTLWRDFAVGHFSLWRPGLVPGEHTEPRHVFDASGLGASPEFENLIYQMASELRIVLDRVGPVSDAIKNARELVNRRLTAL